MPYPGKPRPEIADLHNRAFAAGVPIARVLERSGHSWATWSRLKRGGKAQAVTLDRLTKALDASVPLRDAQILARHADPRTTEHYDRARGNLDRHGVHLLTAYVARV